MSLLAALAQTADLPSPANPLSGVNPASVALIRVRSIETPYPGHGRSPWATDCTIGREHASPFAAAVAMAAPLQSQRRTTEAGFSIRILLDDGRDIGLITSGQELFNDASEAVVMIDGWLYALDSNGIPAMRAAMPHCRRIVPAE